MSKFVLFLFVAICALQILSKPAAAAPLYDVDETRVDPVEAVHAAMERARTQIINHMAEMMNGARKDFPNLDDKEEANE